MGELFVPACRGFTTDGNLSNVSRCCNSISSFLGRSRLAGEAGVCVVSPQESSLVMLGMYGMPADFPCF